MIVMDLDAPRADPLVLARSPFVDWLIESGLTVSGAERDGQRELGFSSLLETLGRRPDEFMSVCHKRRDGRFRSEVCTSSDAPARIAELPADAYVYFGVNPVAGPARTNAGRGKTRDVTRLVALWADLDVKDGGCATTDVAHQIIDDLSELIGTHPSAITRSGGGLQPYWPIHDEADVDPDSTRSLLARWKVLVQAVAAQHGAKVDVVFDAARVLRVPGTYNCKPIYASKSDVEPGLLVTCYADTGDGLTLERIAERLEQCGIDAAPVESAGDVSEPGTWEFADETCAYVRKWLDGIAADVPKAGRHQWVVHQAVRFACALRAGCISEADYSEAARRLDARLRELRAATREAAPRSETVSAMYAGQVVAAAKTDEAARAELGNHDHDRKKSGKRSQASVLVDIALADYRVGISTDGKPFGYSPAAPHVALDLRGGKLGLRQTLARDYFKKYDAAATTAAVASACGVLEGMARETAPIPLHLRVAAGAACVYLDMADEANRVIEIAGGTWRIVAESPLMFRRTELTTAMPDPEPGGDIAQLWTHVNVSEADRPLLLAVMVDALINPDTPKPVTGFMAEHGTAKSTCTRRLVALVDPSEVPLHSVPRDEGHWISAAVGSWMVAIDNLSSIPHWLSDSICRASTGDGDVKRALYTDDGLAVVKFRRSIAINGIDVGGLRGDLADRIVLVELQRIPEEQRLPESEVEARWGADYAGVFGALLDLAAEVHGMLPNLPAGPLPRMADFARVLICVDKITGSNGMQRYRDRLSRAMTDSAVSDPFVAHIVDSRYRTPSTGATSSQILIDVNREGAVTSPPKEWPRTARTVTTVLTRNAPALRAMGWAVDNDGGRNEQKSTKWFIQPLPEEDTEDGVTG